MRDIKPFHPIREAVDAWKLYEHPRDREIWIATPAGEWAPLVIPKGDGTLKSLARVIEKPSRATPYQGNQTGLPRVELDMGEVSYLLTHLDTTVAAYLKEKAERPKEDTITPLVEELVDEALRGVGLDREGMNALIERYPQRSPADIIEERRAALSGRGELAAYRAKRIMEKVGGKL